MKTFAPDSTVGYRGVECSPIETSTRRQLLRRIGFGSLGLGLPTLLRKDAQGATPGRTARAKSCIMIFLFGGPSQLETWDMKPLSPVEYRGEFQPIATSAPGVDWCEHLPRSARLAHHVAVVRSLSMTGRAIGDLSAFAEILAIADRHDAQRLSRGHHRAMARAAPPAKRWSGASC